MSFEPNASDKNLIKKLKTRMSESEANSLLSRAHKYELSRQIEESFDCLNHFWEDHTKRPNTDGFSVKIQGEILLRCAALLSYYTHYQYINDQKLPRRWLSECIEIFKESDSKEQIAEAETELAISFWRESRYTEALGWLQAASVKITNELSSINIKNLSYQLLVLFSINTTQSLQEGVALIDEKDKLVDLCTDSYVKAHYFNNSALLMSKVEQLAESLHRHQKSIEFCKEINNQFTLAIAENNCGYLHNQFKEFSKAVEHTQKAISISQALEIRFLEAECWDTLAQIYLSQQSYAKNNNFSEALLAINTALDVLKTDNFIGKENQAKLKKRDATLVNILQTKAQILIHQNKINEALIIFSTICQNAPNHIIEVYAKDFSRQIEFIEGNSFRDKTENYEKKLLEAAIIKCNGELTKISESLEMPIEKTIELFELRHKDLSKQYGIKINSLGDAKCKSSAKSTQQNTGNFKKVKNSVKVKLKKYDCQGFSAFIPESIEIACIVPITEPRLASVGLIEGRLAVVSSSQINEKYPILIREYINSKYHYGFRIDSMGLIGLESDNSDIYSLRVFDPEIIEIVGEIIGYCQFNTKNEVYEYFPLN